MTKPTSEGTWIGRVRQWCKDNPGEMHTPTDLQTKFGLEGRNYRKVVERLRGEGLIHPQMVYLATKPAPAANDDEGRAAA